MVEGRRQGVFALATSIVPQRRIGMNTNQTEKLAQIKRDLRCAQPRKPLSRRAAVGGRRRGDGASPCKHGPRHRPRLRCVASPPLPKDTKAPLRGDTKRRVCDAPAQKGNGERGTGNGERGTANRRFFVSGRRPAFVSRGLGCEASGQDPCGEAASLLGGLHARDCRKPTASKPRVFVAARKRPSLLIRPMLNGHFGISREVDEQT